MTRRHHEPPRLIGPGQPRDRARDGSRHRYHNGLARALSSLNRLLKVHNGLRRNNGVASHRTQAFRAEQLGKGIRDLHDLRQQMIAAGMPPQQARDPQWDPMRIEDLYNLKERHLKALAALWCQRDYSAAHIQNLASVWSTLCKWIGKEGMARDFKRFMPEPERFARRYVAQAPRTWADKGIDPLEKIQDLLNDTRHKGAPNAGAQLLLCWAFGLRPKEAWLLQPHHSDLGDRLAVERGTKGGRLRDVAIDMIDEVRLQKEVLEVVRTFAPTPQASTIPDDYDLKRWSARFYTLLRLHGITRENGLVAYDLRHGYANDVYEREAGGPSPVAGAVKGQVDPEADHRARLEVAERLGHSRKSASRAYLGAILQRWTPSCRRGRGSDT